MEGYTISILIVLKVLFPAIVSFGNAYESVVKLSQAAVNFVVYYDSGNTFVRFTLPGPSDNQSGMASSYWKNYCQSSTTDDYCYILEDVYGCVASVERASYT